MGYILLAVGIDGSVKTLRSPAGFYSFKKKSSGPIYVTCFTADEQMVRKITADEEARLKKIDRARDGGCLEDVFNSHAHQPQ